MIIKKGLIVLLLLVNLIHCRRRFTSYKKNKDLMQDAVPMIPQQSCYQQNHRLTCSCNDDPQLEAQTRHLTLKMKYYVFDKGDEIRSVHLTRCHDLMVNLDLRGVDATDVPFRFRTCGIVRINGVIFSKRFKRRQRLEMTFDQVEIVTFEDVTVEDKLLVKVRGAKEVRVHNSTFAQIPRRGFELVNVDRLSVYNSTFSRVTSRSISLERTMNARVANNEMSMDADKVVKSTDNSFNRLVFSCNRLLDERVLPDCRITTTTTATTTTTTWSTTTKSWRISSDLDWDRNDRNRADLYYELVAGVIAGVTVIFATCLVIICMVMRQKRRRQKRLAGLRSGMVSEAEYDGMTTSMPNDDNKGGMVTTEEEMSADEAEKDKKDDDFDHLGVEPTVENDVVVAPAAAAVKDEDENVNEEEEETAKFVPPIWLDEIQKNKMFNQQKSLLDKKRKAPQPPKTKKKPTKKEQQQQQMQQQPPPLTEDTKEETEVLKESSRTESEEDLKTKKVTVTAEIEEKDKEPDLQLPDSPASNFSADLQKSIDIELSSSSNNGISRKENEQEEEASDIRNDLEEIHV